MSKNKKKSISQQNIPNNQLQEVVQKVIRQQYYQGPMPHPELMMEYEKIRPGITEFFLEEVKKQTDHRIEIEKKVTQSNITNEKRGSWFAFIITMTALIGGLVLIGLNITTVGIFVAMGSLFTLTAVFITGKINNIRLLKEKKNK